MKAWNIKRFILENSLTSDILMPNRCYPTSQEKKLGKEYKKGLILLLKSTLFHIWVTVLQ